MSQLDHLFKHMLLLYLLRVQLILLVKSFGRVDYAQQLLSTQAQATKDFTVDRTRDWSGPIAPYDVFIASCLGSG
jgi:hypothetical protein